MRILIAESKTMAECDTIVAPDLWREHRPQLDSVATLFMKKWGEWSVDEIVDALKISPMLAAEFKRMAYEFPNKATGSSALEAFTGVVFKALRYSSLTPVEKERANRSIYIVSSLYGLLRGDDIVKPYRLDYTTHIAPTGESMAGYWKHLVTPILLDSMRDNEESELLDLMPADAAKCFDWRMIKRSVRVLKVEFRSIADGGSLRSPHATLLKTLRGRLLRHLIENDIRTFSGLISRDFPDMAIDPEYDPSSGKITILCG